MAKPGLDGHDRGIKILARSYRDAGMEVIYLGLRQTPAMIVGAAIQEDVDVIALSILSGAHMTIFKKVKDLLDQQKIHNILITGGGIIPDEDMQTIVLSRSIKSLTAGTISRVSGLRHSSKSIITQQSGTTRPT